MELDLKKIFQLECLGVLLMVLVFSLFSISSLQKIGRLTHKIKVAEKAVASLSPEEKARIKQRAQEALVIAQENAEIIQGLRNSIRQKISMPKNASLINLEVEDLVAASSMELTNMRHLPAQTHQDYEILPIEMTVHCGFAQLVDFLTQIEKSSTFLAVKKMSIRKGQKDYPLLDVRLTLYALFALENEEKPMGLPGEVDHGHIE